MTVKFHWSRQVIITSIVFCIIALIILPYIVYLCSWRLDFIAYTLPVCVVIACSTPRSLTINSDGITLKRGIGSIGKIKIPLENIVSIEQLPNSSMAHTRFIMGNLGFFGNWGAIKVPNKGKFYMYATELDNLILVKTNFYRSYIFSCREREAFIEQVQKQIVASPIE